MAAIIGNAVPPQRQRVIDAMHLREPDRVPVGLWGTAEGYQNLRRFLFGQVRVDARLAADEITLPAAVQREKDKGKKIRARYNIEVAAKVRNAGCFLNERKVSQDHPRDLAREIDR